VPNITSMSVFTLTEKITELEGVSAALSRIQNQIEVIPNFFWKESIINIADVKMLMKQLSYLLGTMEYTINDLDLYLTALSEVIESVAVDAKPDSEGLPF
jgi:hypothetical protein